MPLAPSLLAAVAFIEAAGLRAYLPAVLGPLLYLWLPGVVALSLLARPTAPTVYAPLGSGPGRLALEAVLGLAVVAVPLFLPFAFGATLELARWTLALTFGALASTALVLAPAGDPWRERGRSNSAWIVAALAAALLVALVAEYAGATVDDWWDLAFVRAYRDGPLSFAEPVLGGGNVHPRFLWNLWYVVQAAVWSGRDLEGWALQASAFAPWVAVASVSASAFLSASLFPERGRAVPIAIAAFALWICGTEALPYFTRLHQDKFVVALVVMPVLLGLVVRRVRGDREVGDGLVFAAAAVAASMHGLVYGVAALGAALVLAGQLRSRRATLAAIAIPGLYPLAQVLWLGSVFESQGIDFSTFDNPVVRAHLRLGRLLAPESAWFVVSPAAVFGPIALLATIGLGKALRARHAVAGRALCLWTAVPLLLFLPGVPFLVGGLWPQWMLYRFGWLIPVPQLLGLALAWRPRPLGRVAAVGLGLVATVLVAPVLYERLWLEMGRTTATRLRVPGGDTLDVLRAVELSGEGVVLAPTGLSTLLPSMAGRSVVALTERGTLVFSASAAEAYGRLRDVAEFYAAETSTARRAAIAARYDVRHAVFARRWMPRSEKGDWSKLASGTGMAGLLGPSGATPFAERSGLESALPDSWSVVYENGSYFVVAVASSSTPQAELAEVPAGELSEQGRPAWQLPFAELLEDASNGGSASDAARPLASYSGYPGISVAVDPVALGQGRGARLVWSRGPALWDDAPHEVRMVMDLGTTCEIDAVFVTPFLRHDRREVLAVEVGASRRVELAHNRRPIVVALDGRPRRSVELTVRSLLAAPLALWDVGVLGDSASCVGDWPLHQEGVLDDAPDADSLLAVERRFPHSGRVRLDRAWLAADAGRTADAVSALRRALRANRRDASTWVALGVVYDEEGDATSARHHYEEAVRIDGRHAWARGALAWSRYRDGRPLAALWHAQRAASLDAHYADAYTIRAYALSTLKLWDLAESDLKRAERQDPWRSWPSVARADFLMRRGRRAEALRALAEFLQRRPDDEMARAALEHALLATDAEPDSAP